MIGESGRRVLALLRDRPRQAQEVSAELGIDTAAVRRHLEGLRAAGYVDRQSVIEGVGRPKMRYALTEEGRETFPRDYAVVLEALMDSVRAASGEDGLKARMRDAAARLAPAARKTSSDLQRLKQLVAFYNELGFEATLARAGDKHVLTQRNCVVWRAARSDPESVCRCFDEGMIKAGVPGCRVRLLATMAEGDSECRHEIQFRK